MGQQNPLPYDTSRMTSFSSVQIIPVIKASQKKNALQAPINQLSLGIPMQKDVWSKSQHPYLRIQKDVWSTGNVSENVSGNDGGQIP